MENLPAIKEIGPADMIASLTSRRGLSLRAKYERTGGFNDAFDCRLSGYALELSDTADVKGAIADLKASLEPAPSAKLAGWIAEMSVKVAIRQTTDFAGELTLKVYARELGAYPADIVRQTLAEWPNASKWWPTWAELREILERQTKPRRLMLAALERQGDEARAS